MFIIGSSVADPEDPYVFGPPAGSDPCIIKQNSKKNLDSYCFVTSLSLKDDVYVPSKSKNQKNLEKQ